MLRKFIITSNKTIDSINCSLNMPFSNVAKLHHAILSFMTYCFNILRSLLSGRFTKLDSIEYQKKLTFRVIIVS